MGHLPLGIPSGQFGAMNTGREEHWRLRLLELKEHLGASQRSMADVTGIDPTYLSRLLYEPGKKGRKNLGLETMASFRTGYDLSAGWFDLPLGSELPDQGSVDDSISFMVKESPPINSPWSAQPVPWPFHLVSYQRLQDLRNALGPKLGQDAISDIDKYLEIILLKWEREVTQRKSRAGR